MSDTKHEKLTAMWITQRELYQRWEFLLLDGAKLVRDCVGERLGVKAKRWSEFDTGIEHEYVEFSDPTDPGNSATKLDSDSISAEGELEFGLRVFFDHGEDAFPKVPYVVAVAVRSTNGKRQYSFWDPSNDDPEFQYEWLDSEIDIADKIIGRIEDALKFDPFIGPPPRIRMGFM